VHVDDPVAMEPGDSFFDLFHRHVSLNQVHGHGTGGGIAITSRRAR
jgi:hypothetical protein